MTPNGNNASESSGSMLLLADDGSSTYRVVVPQSAAPSELGATAGLQTFLELICGARPPSITDDRPGHLEQEKGPADLCKSFYTNS